MSTLLERIIAVDPSLDSQICLGLILMTVFYVWGEACKVLLPLVLSRYSFYRNLLDVPLYSNKSKFLGFDTKTGYVQWTFTLMHHSLGGIFAAACLITGNGAYFRLGVMISTAGLDILDCIRFSLNQFPYQGATWKDFKKKAFHHAFGISLVFPCNLYFSHLLSARWVLFSLLATSNVNIMMSLFLQATDPGRAQGKFIFLDYLNTCFFFVMRMLIFPVSMFYLTLSCYQTSSLALTAVFVSCFLLLFTYNTIVVQKGFQHIQKLNKNKKLKETKILAESKQQTEGKEKEQ